MSMIRTSVSKASGKLEVFAPKVQCLRAHGWARLKKAKDRVIEKRTNYGATLLQKEPGTD